MESRGNLSSDLTFEIRHRVVYGEIPTGRVNEVHLAKQLDVSRTPLRESLMRLAAEHFLETKPRYGFFVPPLTAATMRQLYVIRAKLDPWALELAGIPEPETIRELEAKNEEIREAANDPEAVVSLDDEWHSLLLHTCPNQVVVDLIEQMMWRTRRYELGYFKATRNVSTAHTEHRKLIAALKKNDLREACRRLEANMTSAMPALEKWLAT